MKLELIIDDSTHTVKEFDLTGLNLFSVYFSGDFALLQGRLESPLDDDAYNKFAHELEEKLSQSDVEVTVEGYMFDPENIYDILFSYKGDCDEEDLAWSFDFE